MQERESRHTEVELSNQGCVVLRLPCGEVIEVRVCDLQRYFVRLGTTASRVIPVTRPELGNRNENLSVNPPIRDTAQSYGHEMMRRRGMARKARLDARNARRNAQQ